MGYENNLFINLSLELYYPQKYGVASILTCFEPSGAYQLNEKRSQKKEGEKERKKERRERKVDSDNIKKANRENTIKINE